MKNFIFILSQILGLLAVATFLLSYQQKKRRNIILLNVISRLMYIVQYCLLGAFSGAVLDILGAASSVIAARQFSRCKWLVLLAVDAVIVAAGLLLYENVYSLCAILGVLLQTGAFWLQDERKIRWVSLVGAPFWLVYNFASQAYGSALGDALTIGSIAIAMLRYRRRAS